jgi:hypothetical protein
VFHCQAVYVVRVKFHLDQNIENLGRTENDS